MADIIDISWCARSGKTERSLEDVPPGAVLEFPRSYGERARLRARLILDAKRYHDMMKEYMLRDINSRGECTDASELPKLRDVIMQQVIALSNVSKEHVHAHAARLAVLAMIYADSSAEVNP